MAMAPSERRRAEQPVSEARQLSPTGPQPASRGTAVRVLRLIGRTAGAVAAVVLALVGGLVLLLTQPHWPMLVGVAVIGGAVALARYVARPLAYGLLALVLVGTVLVSATQLTAASPPITDTRGQVVPGSIATVEKVRLGGVDQWVIIRGRSVDNPVLLFLSGGPGGSEIGWLRHYNAALEDAFTVVVWEQRGSGKSASLLFADYGRMTPAQYTADGLELTAYLRQRFHQEKVYVLAKSWGTMLGVWMVQQRPQWFAAFVGAGQMTNPVQDDLLGYQYVLDHARQEGNTALVQRLEQNGPPPYHGLGLTKFIDFIGPLNRYWHREVERVNPGAFDGKPGFFDTPEYGFADKVAANVGLALTFLRVYDQLDDVDLASQATRLEVPIYFAEGRYDYNAMTNLVEDYYAALQAPHKQIVWFEGSGHNPPYEEPAKFHDFMVNTVLAETRGR